MTPNPRIEQAIEEIDAIGGPVDRNGAVDRHKLRTILATLVEAEVRQAVSGNKRAWEIGRKDTLALVDTIVRHASDPSDLLNRLRDLLEQQS